MSVKMYRMYVTWFDEPSLLDALQFTFPLVSLPLNSKSFITWTCTYPCYFYRTTQFSSSFRLVHKQNHEYDKDSYIF